MWVGGALAVYLYQRFQRGEGSPSGAQGAGLGAVSGLVGTFVGVIVYSLTSSLSTPLFASVARFLEAEGDLPFESGGAPSVVGSALFFLVLDVVAYPLFGAISGLLAASLMGKRPVPQA